jgi:general secretion pathway protein C
MELALRRWFWTLDLAFLAGAAALCALTVGALAAHPRLQLPELPAMSLPSAAVQARPALDARAVSQVTGVALLVDEPPGATDEVRSSLAVRLLGTLVANAPEFSLATIQDKNSRQTDVVAEGDALQGATVVSIERLRVLVDNHGRREFIDREGSDSEQAPTPNVGTPPTASKPGEISRGVLLGWTKNLGQEFNKILITPAGKGWRLSRLAPDSMLAGLGLAQGDVVRRINGLETTDVGKLLEAVTQLGSVSLIQVELDRNGAAQRLEFRVRD